MEAERHVAHYTGWGGRNTEHIKDIQRYKHEGRTWKQHNEHFRAGRQKEPLTVVKH